MLDWKTFRPLKRWLVVKADPRLKKSAGGIHLPNQQVAAERVMEGTGRLLKVGNRSDIVKVTGGVALEPGMRICFRGFLKDAFQGFDTDEDGLAIFLLRAEDVLAIVSEDVRMGAFS